jgi:hypothetical protein
MYVQGQQLRRLFRLRGFLQKSLCFVVLGASSATGTSALADDVGGKPALAKTDTAPSNPDVYVGVAPGSANKNPLPKPETGAPLLVWTGFVPSEAGGKVFLQTTMPVTFDAKDGGKQLSLTLHNCKIHLKNNQRDLNTSFFNTPVAGIKTRQHKRDVEVVISLKSAMTAVPRMEDGPDGTKFVVIDFPTTTKNAAAN